MRPPCHNCAERKVGCHSSCLKYKEFRRFMDAGRQKRFDDAEAKAYTRYTSYRMRRKRGEYSRQK